MHKQSRIVHNQHQMELRMVGMSGDCNILHVERSGILLRIRLAMVDREATALQTILTASEVFEVLPTDWVARMINKISSQTKKITAEAVKRDVHIHYF